MHLTFSFGAYFDKSSDVPALEMEKQREKLLPSASFRTGLGGHLSNNFFVEFLIH